MPAPSNIEQYLLELVNDARLNPQGNAARYITSYSPLTSSDSDIQSALNFFGVSGTALQAAFNALVATQPLAWNDALSQSATDHSNAMIAADDQQHVLPGEAGLGERITAAGYTGWNQLSENIYAYADNPLYAHAGFMVDWGYGPNGMQDPAGHRLAIMNSSLREIGISAIIETNPATEVGPLVVTQDFGTRPGGPPVFVLGVAYNDTDANRFYSIGEGLGTLSVSAPGASTTSAASGGYTLGISAGSAVTLTYTGAGLASALTVTANLPSGTNAKIDVVGGTTVLTSISGTFSGPVNRIEALGVVALQLTGDGVAQTIVGTLANDTLNGMGGNDTLEGGAGNDQLSGGNENDLLIGGSGADYLDGKPSPFGGFGDTADYNGATSGVRISLDGSLVATGDAAGDTLIGIENLFGTASADTLKGDNNDNWLRGRGGADNLDGRGGGNDFADYKSSSTGVAVYLDGSGTNAGGEAAGDTLVNIENLRGSDFNDTLVGNSGNNVLRGGAGADLLDGKSNPVTGFGDTADYNGATSGVQISLDGSLVATGDAAGDTLLNIENLFGTGSADTLKGDAGNNWLRGRGGADVLDGGSAGSDWADYNLASVGVAVYLDPLAGTNTNDAAGDTFVSIENLRGSTLNDTLVGDAGNNRLRGNLGNDVLTGGGGADSFQFTDFASVDTVTDFGSGGADMIGLQGAVFSAIGGTVDAGEVVLGTAAADANDYLIFDSTTGTLWYDNDGNGGNTKVAFATLTGVGSLSNTDFFIF